jgi:hypothetical protein
MQALRAIVDRAAQANLPFLLAGGYAVIAHGFPRSTFDIDLIITRNDTNKWVELVAVLGYAVHHQGPTFLHFTTTDDNTLPLDLMTICSLLIAPEFLNLPKGCLPPWQN